MGEAHKYSMDVLVAITGASGAVLGKRLLEELGKRGVTTHLIISKSGMRVIEHELMERPAGADFEYDPEDIGALVASGSSVVDAMVVAPCSMKTLSAIANGYDINLIMRAAACCLKQEKKVVLMPRETPLTYAHIENMRKAKLNGCTIMPPIVEYYSKPKVIGDVTNFFVGRVLKLIGIENDLYMKWGVESESISAEDYA